MDALEPRLRLAAVAAVEEPDAVAQQQRHHVDLHLVEQARAEDRGWNRQLLDEAARRALGAERPAFDWESLELVLVDDRPGVAEDRAHLMAVGASERVRVVLARERDGQWFCERVE